MSEQRFSGMEQKFGEFQKRIEGVRNEVENILNSERGKDDMMRKSGGAGIQSFEDSNRTEIGQYRELSKTYGEYKQAAVQSSEQYASFKKYLTVLTQDKPDFAQFVNVPGLDAYIAANKENLAKISKNSQIVETLLVKYIKPAHHSLRAVLDGINPDRETQKIVMRERKQTEIFEDINQKFGEKFQDFENKVGKVKQSIDNLKQLASTLSTQDCPLNSSDNGVDQIVAALSFFIEYNDKITALIGHYSMIFAEFERLAGVLRDASQARNLNRESLLMDAQNRANNNNTGVNMGSGINNAFQSSWGQPQNQGFGQGFGNTGRSNFGAPQNPYGNGGGVNPFGAGGGSGNGGFNPFGAG